MTDKWTDTWTDEIIVLSFFSTNKNLIIFYHRYMLSGDYNVVILKDKCFIIGFKQKKRDIITFLLIVITE